MKTVALLFFFFLFIGFQSQISAQNTKEDKGDSYEPKGVIAFTSNRDGNFEIYTLDLSSNISTRLTDHPEVDYYTSWKSDGKWIAFYSRRNGNADIFLIRPDGTDLTQLTDHPSEDVLPAISPDGKKIAFISSRDSIGRNLFLMNFTGDQVEQITKNANHEESPFWSPNGQFILFSRQMKNEDNSPSPYDGEIFKYDLGTKEFTRMTYKEGFDSGPKYSPDGMKIAFYGVENGRSDIFLMDSDGQNLINLTNDLSECYSPSWSPDGNWIAYTGGSAENYEIWIINVHTLEKRRITFSDGRDQNPSWSPHF